MRKHGILLSNEDLKRRNWIQELKQLGVTKGREGQPFEEMNIYEIRSQLVLEQIKHGTDMDIESKANVMF